MPTIVHDELLRLATDEDIKTYRNEIEEMPVACSDGTVFDVNDRSEKKLKGAIDRWPLLNVTTLPWTLADNTTKNLTLAELTAYTAEALTIRDLRAFPIHQQSLTFKSDPSTTVRDLENWKAGYFV